MSKILILFLAIFLSVSMLAGQSGNPHIRWNAAVIEAAVLHYPDYLSNTAGMLLIHYENIMHQYKEKLPYYKSTPTRPMHIVLTDNDDIGSAYVIPRRNLIVISTQPVYDHFLYRRQREWLSSALAHELAHEVTLDQLRILPDFFSGFSLSTGSVWRKTQRNAYAVFTPSEISSGYAEGLAQYFSAKAGYDSYDNNRAMLARTALLGGLAVEYEDLFNFINKNTEEAELLYNLSFCFFLYLENKFGDQIFSDAFSKCRSDLTISFDSALGMQMTNKTITQKQSKKILKNEFRDFIKFEKKNYIDDFSKNLNTKDTEGISRYEQILLEKNIAPEKSLHGALHDNFPADIIPQIKRQGKSSRGMRINDIWTAWFGNRRGEDFADSLLYWKRTDTNNKNYKVHSKKVISPGKLGIFKNNIFYTEFEPGINWEKVLKCIVLPSGKTDRVPHTEGVIDFSIGPDGEIFYLKNNILFINISYSGSYSGKILSLSGIEPDKGIELSRVITHLLPAERAHYSITELACGKKKDGLYEFFLLSIMGQHAG